MGAVVMQISAMAATFPPNYPPKLRQFTTYARFVP